MNDFENNDYGTVDENRYIGGYYTGEENVANNRNITPEISFQIDLLKSYNFLENYLNEQEFSLIKSSVDKFNQKLFKNPTLILLSFIVLKNSKKQQIEPQRIRNVYTDPDISPLIKENNISMYDIVRYCRYIVNFNIVDLDYLRT